MKYRIMIVLCAILLLLAGCGTDEELEAFHADMDSFYENLAMAAGSLEAIDPASETAVEDLLAQLDTMNEQFAFLAALEVPEQFSNITELADEAASYMDTAAGYYHDAYADGGYDENIAAAAGEHYARAMKRVNYIAILLQGRIPEDENITVIPQEDEPDWTGGDLPDSSQE